ncbi:Astacin-like metalloendopeptidase [Manis javanica]|nr:Astacin-like metalloendopeptidase [Manis javanica]
MARPWGPTPPRPDTRAPAGPAKGVSPWLYALSPGGPGPRGGVVHSLLQVRSPAPPLVALVGLLGILAGEQIVPVGRHLLQGMDLRSACSKTQATEHFWASCPAARTPISDADRHHG